MQAKTIFLLKNLCIPKICCNFVGGKEITVMSKGQFVVVSPELTGLTESITGEIINVRQNPFLGQEIAARDSSGRVFFGESKYFTAV